MTWHHVAALLIAAAMTVIVVSSVNASQAIGPVFNLDGIIVAGVFGHAGASRILQRRTQHEGQNDGEGASQHGP
jgi:hypothetical protein